MDFASLTPVAGAPFLAPPLAAQKKKGKFWWIGHTLAPGKKLWRKLRGGAEPPKPELGHEIVVEAVAEKIEGVQNGVENMHRSVMETAKEFSPAQIMSRKTKEQLRNMAKGNWGTLALLGVEAAVYCAVFEELKSSIKHSTRNIRYVGKSVAYFFDYMQPTALFGPLYGFLFRVSLPF